MITLICKRRPAVVEVSEVVRPESADEVRKWCGGENAFFEDADFAFTIPGDDYPQYVEWGGRVVHEADGRFTAISELEYVTDFTWSGYVRRDRNG